MSNSDLEIEGDLHGYFYDLMSMVSGLDVDIEYKRESHCLPLTCLTRSVSIQKTRDSRHWHFEACIIMLVIALSNICQQCHSMPGNQNLIL